MTATLSNQTATVRTTWDNTDFFNSTHDPRIATTIETLKADIQDIGLACQMFGPAIATAETLGQGDEAAFAPLIQQIYTIHQQRQAILDRLGNVSTYIYTALSADTQDPDANTYKPILQKLGADLEEVMTPFNVFLIRASDEFVTALLAESDLAEIRFLLHHRRKLKDQLLSVAEEKLITGLATSGLHAWGNLYSELAGSLKCTVQGEEMGLAKAANLLSHPEATIRKAAWDAIRVAWRSQQSPVTAGLNAINGWRLEETEKRSHIRKLHYLDKSCHQSRIERETLDALIETT